MKVGRTAAVRIAVLVAVIAVFLWVAGRFLILGGVIAQERWDDFRRCRGHTRFDQRKWNDSALVYSRTAPRECMVDNLLSHHSLIGKSRSEVVALLGEPRPTNYFKEYDLVYWLGPERSLISIDSIWLVMKLDSAGRVTEARLVTD